MAFNRTMQQELLQMAKEYPVVTLTGPRQAGKTVLVQNTFKRKPYLNLEDPENQMLALEDPKGLLAQYPDGLILDEVQKAPKLLSYIQVLVDKKRTNGQYILTGSHQLDLRQQISQSLAGRTALLTLLPLSLKELLSDIDSLPDLDELMLNGLLPRVYEQNQQPTKAYRNYLQTYIERDVRQLIQVRDLITFQKFIGICASRIGQLVNYDNLAVEVGVSNHTIKNWLSILEASFVIFQLKPYHANISKRLIKSTKLYMVDVGLAAYLLGIENSKQLSRDPLRGQLFENFIILELMKHRLNLGLDPNLYFYRDRQQHEVDVIFKRANQLIPIEIKSGQTFQKSFTKELDYFMKVFPDQCQKGFVVYAGTAEQNIGWKELINYQNLEQVLNSDIDF